MVVTSAKVSFKMYPGPAIGIISDIANKAAYTAAQRARGRVIANIRRLGRVDTGQMVQGIQIRKLPGHPLMVQYIIASSARHTIYQEYGTPGHGPRRAPFMVFTPKGSSVVVFAKYVRGITPGNFFRDALAEVKPSDAVS